MLLEDYLAKYGVPADAPELGSGSGPYINGLLAEGMLQFDEDTACCWGGPFPGDCAYFRLQDARYDHHGNPRTLQPASIDAQIEALVREALGAFERDGGLLYQQAAETAFRSHFTHQYASTERPYQLYLTGTDDVSFTRTFATEDEARGYLAHLEAAQPLDMHREIHPHFAFTN